MCCCKQKFQTSNVSTPLVRNIPFSNMWREQQALIIIVEILWCCDVIFQPSKLFQMPFFSRQNQHFYPHGKNSFGHMSRPLGLTSNPVSGTYQLLIGDKIKTVVIIMVLHRINVKTHFTKPGTWLKKIFLSSHKFCLWANI